MHKHLPAAIVIMVILVVAACQSKPEQAQTGTGSETPAQKPRYDWTGTYVFPDETAETGHTLRLHKRSVDGSYEMQYSKSVKAQTSNYSEYMFDAKDGDSSITIRFMGSFTADEQDWPFKKGDTLCVLIMQADGNIHTTWLALRPQSGEGSFKQVSKDYH